ncbi:MAG: hypothetical protein V4598_02790 [Bdellovibrionota bacterium]
MAQGDAKKEALFNEVKGSLFEYLVGKEIAVRAGDELSFQKSLDPNYLTVLAQQDRMVRQFYPEMTAFLSQVSKLTTDELEKYTGKKLTRPKLLGKFINSSLGSTFKEADLAVDADGVEKYVSLKLNKKNAYVNTKSGGIKSFFSHYFSFVSPVVQEKFNTMVEMEFETMARELHAFHDMPYPGNFSSWVKKGFSELPGELSEGERGILKAYYARIARDMHLIMTNLENENPLEFRSNLATLMGFGQEEVIQAVCFHDMKEGGAPYLHIHELKSHSLGEARLLPFENVSSVELNVGGDLLQIRVKPMNKFTTTAIKINCSVKFSKRPSGV